MEGTTHLPSPSFSFASPKENEAKEKATLSQLLRRLKGALRCWERCYLAAWRWIFARCILSIGLECCVLSASFN
jgi:hypothetical protein